MSKGNWRETRRRSKRQEKRIKKETGGSRTPGSGRWWQLKGDVQKLDVLRIECKTTKAKGYRVTLEELQLIAQRAGGETPILQLDFETMGGRHSYGIMRWDDIRLLFEQAGIPLEDE